MSDDSRQAAGHHADEEVSDSRSERSDVAVRCAAVNKRAARRQVTMIYTHHARHSLSKYFF